MGELNHKVREVISKINLIIDKYMELEQQNLRLVEERNELLQLVAQQKEQGKILENKIRFLKMTKGVGLNPEESKNVKEKINKYIREIDKCIGLLNN